MFLSKYPFQRKLLSLLITVTFTALIFLLMTGFLQNTLSEKSLNTVSESIRRAAVQCYAIEGAFPTELSYLQKKYGITVDNSLYFIDYQYIASNLMPDITVIPMIK